MKTCKLSALIITAALTACGGSGSGSGDPTAGIDAGGSPVLAFARGTISGFGSVIVNGVHYDTSGATISIDGSVGSESDLAVGQVVTVRGTIDDNGTTGDATEVSFEDLVEAPIESIDLAAGSFVALGQTVLVTADTTFEAGIVPAGLEGLAVGDVVEVSGFLDANGNIVATYIELEDRFDEFEVTGLVQNLDTATSTFEINTLTVDYSAAMLEDFPGGAPENGQLVEAQGVALGANGELLATRVEFKGDDDFANGDNVEIEGFITRFVSASDFDVSGVAVSANGSTAYENGSAADLALNRKVEVEGEVNASGTLVARKIEFKLAGTLRVEGLVDDVAADSLTVFGIDIMVTSTTELEDKSSMDIRNFDLSDVNVGDYVEIRAFDSGNALVATRLERDDFDGKVALRGFVETVNDPEFTILGVTIRTNAGTEFQDNDTAISASSFFSQAQGRLVDAEGSPDNGGILADKAELEN